MNVGICKQCSRQGSNELGNIKGGQESNSWTPTAGLCCAHENGRVFCHMARMTCFQVEYSQINCLQGQYSGSAVPPPVRVRTREYDEHFFSTRLSVGWRAAQPCVPIVLGSDTSIVLDTLRPVSVAAYLMSTIAIPEGQRREYIYLNDAILLESVGRSRQPLMGCDACIVTLHELR